MATLTEEIAGKAIGNLLANGVGIETDRMDEAKSYASDALDDMALSSPDLDPRDDTMNHHVLAKEAAILFTKLKLQGQTGVITSEPYVMAKRRWSKQGIREFRQNKADNDKLVDDNQRIDMFDLGDYDATDDS